MILDDLKNKRIEFMKSHDEARLGVLRYFLSLVQNKEIELRTSGQSMTDELVFKVLRKQIKDRRETRDIYIKSGRTDLVEKESRELDILGEFAKLFPFELDLESKVPPSAVRA